VAAIDDLVPRRLLPTILERLGEEPVIALQGARSVGKSTLLHQIARVHGREVIDLDDLETRDAVRADPGLYAGGEAPVFIDEFQHAPMILDAIKAELNTGLRAGRFILTGSTRYDALPAVAQALTGRLHLVTVWPLSQGEIDGRHEDFVETLLRDPGSLVSSSNSTTTRNDYVQRIVRGGFPIPLSRTSPSSRGRWFNDYVGLVLQRDLLGLAQVRQRAQLPRLLSRLAGQTAQPMNIARVTRDVGLDPVTAEEYTRLLEAVFLVHRLPAWGRNLRARAAAKPKLHVVDSGVAAHLMRVNAERLVRVDPVAQSELGHLLETFCVGEILKQLAWADDMAHVGHWRTYDGDEVDLVLERSDGAVVGVEFKASSRVEGSTFRGLQILRDSLGPTFLGGVVLHTGQRSYTYEDRLHVAPIDRMWRPRSAA
jgi:uncharacterized protein